MECLFSSDNRKDLKTIETIVTIDNMEISTIQLSKETKRKISTFGAKGESYDEILRKIYSMALKEQFREYMMSEGGFVPIEEAIKEAEKKWPK